MVSDLAEPGAAEWLANEAGDVDLLVANAALPGSGKLESFSTEEISRAVRVNLEAPIILTRVLMPGMIARGKGHLVYVSSLSGKAASPRASIYNGTKFGLRGFALALREDLAGDGTGVGASVVLPGFIRDAGMFADSGAKAPPGTGTSTPGGGRRRRDQGDRRRQGRGRGRARAAARDGAARPRLPGARRASAAWRRDEDRRAGGPRPDRQALSAAGED